MHIYLTFIPCYTKYIYINLWAIRCLKFNFINLIDFTFPCSLSDPVVLETSENRLFTNEGL